MPYSETITFAQSGRTGHLEMPDLYDLLVGMGEIPSPEITAVIQLLHGEGSLNRQDLLAKLRGSAEHYLRLYRLAGLCLASPRLILARRQCTSCGHIWDGEQKSCPQCMSPSYTVVHARGDDEIGPKDLTLGDLSAIYIDFFLSRAALLGPAPADDIGGPAGAGDNREGVRDTAEHLPQD